MSWLILAIVPIIIYLIWYIIKYGVPESFSATYKKVEDKWHFTIVLWALAIALIIGGSSVWYFLSGSLLTVVGVARRYWDPSEKTMHFVGAIGSILTGMLGIILTFKMWWATIPFFIFFFLTDKFIMNKSIINLKNSTFYIELVGFLTLYLTLFIK